MAYARCGKCGNVIRSGPSPGQMSGLILIPALGAAIAVFLIRFRHLAGRAFLLRFFLSDLTAAAVLLGIIFLFTYLPLIIEWIFITGKRCPSCGSRRWSFPFTKGFGI